MDIENVGLFFVKKISKNLINHLTSFSFLTKSTFFNLIVKTYKMKNILIVFCFGLVFVGCSRSTDRRSLNRINENELIINDGTARYLGELYTGIAVELRDDGNIARQYTYRNGVLFEDRVYENGEKISTTWYDEEGNEIDNPY